MVLPIVQVVEDDFASLSTTVLRAGAKVFGRVGLRGLASRLCLEIILRECRAVEDETEWQVRRALTGAKR